MSAVFEGRTSDSPYIEMVWRGHVENDYAPTCPADVRWNFLFLKQNRQIRVSAEGPTTKSVFKTQSEGSEFLVIKFKLGAYMPYLPVIKLVDGDAVLPDATSKTFYLNGTSWQIPDFSNVEIFVERLVREEVLVCDPLVTAVLQNQPQYMSSRTIRRRFLSATGLTPKSIQQIERAQQAATLLGQGESILNVTYRAGYADQPHLTRSLKRFYGQTPAQIVSASGAVKVPE